MTEVLLLLSRTCSWTHTCLVPNDQHTQESLTPGVQREIQYLRPVLSSGVEASDEVVVEVWGGSSSRLVMFEDLDRASPRLYPDHLAEGLDAVEMTLCRPRRVEEL